MPILTITSNVASSSVDVSAALKALSVSIPAALGPSKPEANTLVTLLLDQRAIYSGSEAPAAWGTLNSFGEIDAEKNKHTIALIGKVVEEQLGVEPNRFALWALTASVASILGVPEALMLVHLRLGEVVSFGGTMEPAAWVALRSIRGLGGETNKALAKAIGEVLTEKLGVPTDRAFIFLDAAEPSAVGYKGTTF